MASRSLLFVVCLAGSAAIIVFCSSGIEQVPPLGYDDQIMLRSAMSRRFGVQRVAVLPDTWRCCNLLHITHTKLRRSLPPLTFQPCVYSNQATAASWTLANNPFAHGWVRSERLFVGGIPMLLGSLPSASQRLILSERASTPPNAPKTIFKAFVTSCSFSLLA
ncbi:uncharacterized protein EI97DRAFT_2329 [Westerdykella ornata]|uniref:Uncharacterized protein n=1 Tax=Westerdykella ornata TaxID=318751 RepID=A0A6A6JXR7_WESOR|nr:uncharacterized protein EI97DRAFT_2329 [Westerdykella ornata]KAF2280608.1 hypothetical protein EI97DRAFT_2329 [Westerdykella ornata]